MPGMILPGSRYFQELAPEVAMDLAEHVGMDKVVETPTGTYTGCLKIKETSLLEPNCQKH